MKMLRKILTTVIYLSKILEKIQKNCELRISDLNLHKNFISTQIFLELQVLSQKSNFWLVYEFRLTLSKTLIKFKFLSRALYFLAKNENPMKSLERKLKTCIFEAKISKFIYFRDKFQNQSLEKKIKINKENLKKF